MIDLNGIHVPIVTPFEKEKLASRQLIKNLEFLNSFPLRGYVLLGSTGEAVMLSEKEKFEFVDFATEHIPEDKLVGIGAMFESNRLTIDFLRRCADLGADLALVLPPHYYKTQMTPAVLETFYLSIADESPLPVIIYHFPAVSGIQLSVKLIAKLAHHPKIIGIKDSSGDLSLQQSILAQSLSDFQVLTGTANTLASSIATGAAGGIVAYANIAPGHCLDILHRVREGKWRQAQQLQLKITRLNQLVTKVYGIGGLKYAMDQIGLFGGAPRSPLQLPDSQGQSEIVMELKNVGLRESRI